MGENLVWLANEWFPDRKLIVWAASLHIARNLDEIDVDDDEIRQFYTQYRAMGDYVSDALGEQAYALGFVAYEGRYGTLQGEVRNLEVASPDSLAGMLVTAGFDNAILDLRGAAPRLAWLRTPIPSRPFGYRQVTADWTRVLDGVMLTRVMTPVEDEGSPWQ